MKGDGEKVALPLGPGTTAAAYSALLVFEVILCYYSDCVGSLSKAAIETLVLVPTLFDSVYVLAASYLTVVRLTATRTLSVFSKCKWFYAREWPFEKISS